MGSNMIRVIIPQHLRTLAHVGSEVTIEVEGPATQRSVLDALEARYPMLRGGGTGNDKDSSPDDSANPKGNQVAGTECTPQAMFASFLGFVKYDRDRLGRQQVGHWVVLDCLTGLTFE